jgi:glycogen(starch) synthase
MFNELRDTCEAIKEEMGRRLFRSVAQGRLPTIEELLDEYAVVRLKRMMYAWRSSPPPAIVTHDLLDDANDPVLNHLRTAGLWNLRGRPREGRLPPGLPVADQPAARDGVRPVRARLSLGVFPSYYEPWGYTPLECIVSGIPAITSDLSGFGDYVMQNFPDHDEAGMYVAQRRGMPFHVSVAQVAEWLYQMTRMTRRQRIDLRNKTESFAEHFDWNHLARHYATAHRMALEQKYGSAKLVPTDPVTDVKPARTRRPRTRRKAGQKS